MISASTADTAGTGATPGGRRWFGRRGDLPLRPFPAVSGSDPASRRQAVDDLRAWAEARAEDAIAWYRRDKRLKRIGSRALRAASIVLAIAGGAFPLASAAWQGEAGGWGYVLLAAAAGSAAFDHFFGISAGWMRDMTTLQALTNKLERFRLEWSSDLLLAPPPQSRAGAADEDAGGDLARQLGLVREFVAEVTHLVESETSTWLTEFRAKVNQLHSQTGLGAPE